MSEQTVPVFEICVHGRPYKLETWYRWCGMATYVPVSRIGPDVEAKWQDENRTWLTIDEVYATRWDCMAARLEAAA